MAQSIIEVAVDAKKSGLVLGEGPHWDDRAQELVYVDIIGGSLRRYVPSTGEDFKLQTEGRPSLIVPYDSLRNNYVIGIGRNLERVEWDGKSAQAKRSVVTTVNDQSDRFNDGKCDHQGRLWAGTMGAEIIPGKQFDEEKGNLYKLDTNGQVSAHVDKIGISNGLGWSTDSKRFFYVDSLVHTVDVFDFDSGAGTISNRRVLYDLKKNGNAGLPDGLAVDADNNLWVATFNGAKILHIDGATGQLIDAVDFTGISSKLTSVAFGGPNLDIMYVTSANFGLSDAEAANEKSPGSLFKVTNTGGRGQSAGVNYRGSL